MIIFIPFFAIIRLFLIVDYINCTMNKEEYISFRNALINSEKAEIKDFEKETANYFEGCLPIEEIARRGIDTMRYGPLKSIGLWIPKWAAILQT